MRLRRRFQLVRSSLWIGTCAGILACAMAQDKSMAGTANDAVATTDSPVRGWQYAAPIELPGSISTELVDVVLGTDVFTHARFDLADLRIFDQAKQPIPYALRVLRARYQRRSFPAEEFNRAQGPNGSSELTLDLQRDNVEHNELEITTPGENFRRKVEVAGSNDGKTWSLLANTHLLAFHRGNSRLNANTVSYPPSRFRHLRIRVFPDPLVDKSPVAIEKVAVVRKVEIAGEKITLDGVLKPREPVRADGAAGSAWIVDLGGDHIPCDQIEVTIDDSEFVRNYYVEAAGSASLQSRFARVALTQQRVWQRRAGEPKVPLVAHFHEVRASRLRIVVVDHGNPPLHLRSVRFSAPVRQLVFAKPLGKDVDLKLYFGNPKAEAPKYDFARSLPERLSEKPTRGSLGPLHINPDYVPPPKPLTERWPWLIYLVLGVVSTLLALIILSVARRVIARHDQQAAPTAP